MEPNHLDPKFREMQRAAGTFGIQLQSLEVRQLSDFDGAFQAPLSPFRSWLGCITNTYGYDFRKGHAANR
jgi:hypothetical protein